MFSSQYDVSNPSEFRTKVLSTSMSPSPHSSVQWQSGNISHIMSYPLHIYQASMTWVSNNGGSTYSIDIIEYFHKLWHEVIMNPESDYWRSYRSRQIREISPVEALKWEQTMRHLQSLF